MWVMVPAGDPTEQTVEKLGRAAGAGRHDHRRRQHEVDRRRAPRRRARAAGHQLRGRGHERRRVGPPGGLLHDGRRARGGRGAAAPILDVLAPPPDKEWGPGWDRRGSPASGHYVKMVHNGVEYGLMQAYAEGFELFTPVGLRARQREDRQSLDAGLGRALLALRAGRPRLRAGGQRARPLRGYVNDSGEGRWTIEDAIDHDVPTPVITAALFARFTAAAEASTPQGAGRAAQPVRGPRRREGVVSPDGSSSDGHVEQQQNPLIEGLERLPVHPTTLVIFGGTGDLAKRKLLPAIYNLAHEGALPERFNLIAVSRSDIPHDEYREMALESIKQFSPAQARREGARAAAPERALRAGHLRRRHDVRAPEGVPRGVRQGRGDRLQPRLLPLHLADASSR